MINDFYKNKISVLKRRYDKLKQNKEKLLDLIDENEIAEAVYNSNAIENSTLTLLETEQILAELDMEKSFNLREVFEAKNLARVNKFLKNQGLDNNTLVIFSSDNGPEHNNHPTTWNSVGETGGLKGRKRSLYEGGVKVPFIVRFPGKLPAGKVDTTSIIASVDLLPTICNMTGVKLPKEYKPDGENITNALKGKSYERKKPILQYWQGNAAGLNWPRLSADDGKWKLLMNYDKSKVELYNHITDWGEENNVAKNHPDVVERLSKMCLDYYHSLPLIKRPIEK